MIAGVGRGAPRPLAALAQDRPGELVFAEALSGDRYALDGDGRVLRYDAGADERALAGSTFERWLDATVAREQILFGPDGEYAPDVFDPSGQEVTPAIALRQAERALKMDPGAADAEHARGWRSCASGGGTRRWPPSAPRPSWTRRIRGRCSISGAPRWRSTRPRRAAGVPPARPPRARPPPRRACWPGPRARRRGRRRRRRGVRAEALARDPRLVEGLRARRGRRRGRRRRGRDEEPALLAASRRGRRCRAGCP